MLWVFTTDLSLVTRPFTVRRLYMSVTVTWQDLGTKLNGHIAGLSEIYVEVIKLRFRDCPTQIVTGKLTERYTCNTEGEREKRP